MNVHDPDNEMADVVAWLRDRGDAYAEAATGCAVVEALAELHYTLASDIDGGAHRGASDYYKPAKEVDHGERA